MALPSSPPISSEQIRLQYGGSLPFRIQDYYRGGALVPNTGANSNIPTSGPISFYNFLGQGGSGGGGGGLAVAANNVNASSVAPAAASGASTASGSGGTGPYTYAWTVVSGGAGISPSGPSSGATRSFSTTTGGVANFTGVYRVTVTDSLGATAFRDVNVNLTRQ